MYKLRLKAKARQDLKQIRRYIAMRSKSKSVAAKFVKELRDTCQQLADAGGTLGTARPELGPNTRSFPYDKNYVIFFQYQEDALVILTIIEGHRDIQTI